MARARTRRSAAVELAPPPPLELDASQLEHLTELAKLQFQPSEAAAILQVDAAALAAAVLVDGSPAHVAWVAGRLLAEYETRKATYNMAKHGSTPALKDWTELQRRTARLEARGRARTAPTTGDTP